MSTVADLWALQTTDLAVEAIRQRLAELEKQLSERAELKTARAAAVCLSARKLSDNGWTSRSRAWRPRSALLSAIC